MRVSDIVNAKDGVYVNVCARFARVMGVDGDGRAWKWRVDGPDRGISGVAVASDTASQSRTQTRARGAFARSRAGDDCVKIYAVAFARSRGRSRGRVGDGGR
jgi:hypothetical protein